MQLTHSCTKRLGKGSSHSSTLPKSIPSLKTACTYHEEREARKQPGRYIRCARFATLLRSSLNHTRNVPCNYNDRTNSKEHAFCFSVLENTDVFEHPLEEIFIFVDETLDLWTRESFFFLSSLINRTIKLIAMAKLLYVCMCNITWYRKYCII